MENFKKPKVNVETRWLGIYLLIDLLQEEMIKLTKISEEKNSCYERVKLNWLENTC